MEPEKLSLEISPSIVTTVWIVAVEIGSNTSCSSPFPSKKVTTRSRTKCSDRPSIIPGPPIIAGPPMRGTASLITFRSSRTASAATAAAAAAA